MFVGNIQFPFIALFRNSNVILNKAIAHSVFFFLMIDKLKNIVDNNKVFRVLFTDLSKVFDCICDDLLNAKLNASGLSLPALKII